MDIEYSPEFIKCFKKLPKKIKLKAVEKEKVFRKNYLDSILKTHKLHGKLSGKLAFSVDAKIRIIFSLVSPSMVRFHSIGGHDIYK